MKGRDWERKKPNVNSLSSSLILSFHPRNTDKTGRSRALQVALPRDSINEKGGEK
jgi:hypothetical protein